MLNNLLLGAKNVPPTGRGIPKTIGGEQVVDEGDETKRTEKQQQQTDNARNALNNLLGARLNRPPPSIVVLPQIPESRTSNPQIIPTVVAGNTTNNNKNNNNNLPLNKDPRFEKYFRMLKVGMPLTHVKHAMQRDGLNPDIMDQDPNQPLAATSTKKENNNNLTTRKPRQRKASGPRRARFRWNKIQNFFTESIWGDLSDDETIKSIDIDEEEFTELFQEPTKKVVAEEESITPSVAIQRAPATNKKKKTSSAVRVIDAKRANNGGISLARIKMTFDQVSQNVDQMDLGDLTAGQIENMIDYLPSISEQERLTEYMLNVEKEEDLQDRFDSLCECEKFMVSIMTVKHAKEKLDAMHFKLDFQGSLDSIVQDADLVDKACDELRNSTRLKKVLGIVLEIGNKLNTAAQGPEDKANGFSLDSLLKLKQTKAFDKKTTFLNYIVSIVERNDESLLDFAQDIQTVIKASKVYWDVCVSEMNKVETQVENLRRMALYEAKCIHDHGDICPKEQATPDSIRLPEDKELEFLQSTSTGRFTMDAMKQLSQLQSKVDSTMDKYQNLLKYFGEDDESSGEVRSKRPHELFSIFSQFSRDFQQARPSHHNKTNKNFRKKAAGA